MTVSLYIVAFLLGLGALSFLRSFRVTRAKTELFVGIGGLIGAFYVLLIPIADRGAVRFQLDFAAGLIIGFLGSTAMAYSFTIESGLLTEISKNTPLRNLFIGRPRRPPAQVPPKTSRRTGILTGALFIVLGVAHHLFFPWAHLFFTFVLLCIGTETVILSLLNLK